MHEEDAFLSGVQADPKNDLLKLVYADWLDERGRDAEATFIRDNIPPRDPKPWSPMGVRGGRVGQAWWDLYSGADRVWDARTMLALGRLQGMLSGLAAANDHTSDIHHDYSADLELLSMSAEEYRNRLIEKGVVLTVVDDWQAVVGEEVARWIGMDQGRFNRSSVIRRAHQTQEGCRRTADRILGIVREVISIHEVWRQQQPPAERWGIDFSAFVLFGPGRALTLRLDFDD